MRKLAVSITKGGTGKTTTTVNLAAGLALQGARVLVVDADSQGQAGQMLGLKPEHGLAEVISQAAKPETAVVEARPNLYLLAGGRALAGARRLIARKDFGSERTLAEALDSIEGQYDFVIFDTAPGWDPLTVNVLFYATEVLAPVSLEILTIQGLVEFIGNIESIQKYNPTIMLQYVLPTFFDRRVKKSAEILAQLEAYWGDKLCPPIRYNVRLSEAPGHSQTIFEYAPRSAGAQDYQKLTERIQNGRA
jgi:chromosome partitioning protein